MPTHRPRHEPQRRPQRHLRGILSALFVLALLTFTAASHSVIANPPATDPNLTKPRPLTRLQQEARQAPEPPKPDFVAFCRSRGVSFDDFDSTPIAIASKRAAAIRWAFDMFDQHWLQDTSSSWEAPFRDRDNFNRFLTPNPSLNAQEIRRSTAAIDYFEYQGIFAQLDKIRITDPIIFPEATTNSLDGDIDFVNDSFFKAIPLARLLHMRYWIALYRNQPDIAFSTIEPRLALARHFHELRTLRGHLAAGLIYPNLLTQIIDGAMKGDFTPQQYRTIRSMLATIRTRDLHPMLNLQRVTLIRYEWLTLQSDERLLQILPSTDARKLIDSRNRRFELDSEPESTNAPNPVMERSYEDDLKSLNECFDLVKRSVLTPRFQHRNEIAALHAAPKTMPKQHAQYAEVLAWFVTEHDELDLLLTAADTTIAVELFRREHNRLPDSLEELIPKYLAELPIDICSGKPLIYRKLAGNDIKTFDRDWLLISTGDDQRENPGNYVISIRDALSPLGMGGDIDLNRTSYYQRPDLGHFAADCCKQAWLTNKPCIHAEPTTKP